MKIRAFAILLLALLWGAGTATAAPARLLVKVRPEMSARSFAKSLIRAKRLARGRPVAVVFDLDNTLLDSRFRTALAMRRFARAQPKLGRVLRRIRPDQVGYDGASTARAFGLRDKAVEAAQQAWLQFFWKPGSFRADRAIKKTLSMAKIADRLGVHVFYLTGRVEHLKPASLKQLRRIGAPLASSSHLFNKPSVDIGTEAFKQDVLLRIKRRGFRVARAISDSTADGRAALRAGVPAAVVRFPVGPPKPVPLSTKVPEIIP